MLDMIKWQKRTLTNIFADEKEQYCRFKVESLSSTALSFLSLKTIQWKAWQTMVCESNTWCMNIDNGAQSVEN